MRPNIPIKKNENDSDNLNKGIQEISHIPSNRNSNSKKIFILLIIIIILLIAIITCTIIYLLPDKSTEDSHVVFSETSHYERGDINGDGLIDAVDASLILDYYAYRSTNGTMSFDEFIENLENQYKDS